jgi:hypothetical protein
MTTHTLQVEHDRTIATHLALSDAAFALRYMARNMGGMMFDSYSAEADIVDELARQAYRIIDPASAPVEDAPSPTVEDDPAETFWQCRRGHMTTPPVRYNGADYRFCPQCEDIGQDAAGVGEYHEGGIIVAVPA